MDCKDFDYYISLYIDDMLEEQDKEELENHLKQCKICRESFQETQDVISMVNSLEPEPVPHGFKDKLFSRMGSGRTLLASPWLRWAGAVAGVLVIFFSIKAVLDTGITDRLATTVTPPGEIVEDAIGEESGVMSFESPAEDEAAMEVDDTGYADIQEEVLRDEDGVDIISKEQPRAEISEIQSDVVEVYVQDICITPETLKFIAIDNELELIGSDENSIDIKVSSQEDRSIIYHELSKLGEVKDIGENMDNDQVKIIIRAGE